MRFATVAITAIVLIGSVDLAVTRCAAEETAAPAAYEVLRVGDRDMTCPQLAAEANSLNAIILAQNKPRGDGNGRRVGGAVAGGLLRGAGHFGLARFGGALPGMGGMFARAAVDTAANSAGQAVANSGQEDPQAPPVVTPEQQRMNHLLGIYKEKNC